MIDPFGRNIEILRVSVTDRCNFRCVYCMPESGVPFIDHSEVLSYEEITQVVQAGIKMGINKIRLTGGEPLIRPGIVILTKMLADLPGIKELAMTTNGALLTKYAKQLKEAGLNRVNISLDTLNPIRFREITRGGSLDDVIAGIDAAIDAGLTPVKLNIVVPPEISDNDAVSVETFARTRGLVTRRIRRMDIRTGTHGVVENSDRGDCSVCNRLRLSSDGYIRCCLLADQRYSVRKYGPERAFELAVLNKPEAGQGTISSYMYQIGG